MAGLKDMMAAQEIELIVAGAARAAAEQGRQRLEAECQRLRSSCSGESLMTLCCASILSMCPIVN
jgi:hypothetical protein